MMLQVVWQVLRDGDWASKQSLREASGVDDNTINRIISFLDRWDFVDVQRSPELLIRRKPGAISPEETFALLTEMVAASPLSKRPKLAERVACRICNGRELSFVGGNEVECDHCHEKQWYAIEMDYSSGI